MSEPVAGPDEAATLRALLEARLGARVLALFAERGVTVATVRDAAGEELTIEWWEGRPERPSYRDGRLLRFAHRGALDAERADRLVDALLADEERIAALGRRARLAPATRPREGQIVFLTEKALGLSIARALPRARSIEAATRAALDRAAAGAAVGHVMLYFEARCEQACEFCEEPGLRERPLARLVARALDVQQALGADLVSRGAFAALLAWVRERPERIVLHVTGHDWLRHPHLDALLGALERGPGVPLRLQGPSLALADRALARRVAALPGLQHVATTLQSSDPREHDAMVGRPGAHARLLAALEVLSEEGVAVLLTLVLTRRALRTLPATLAWLRERGRAAQLCAFVPDRAMEGGERALAPLDELRAALAGVAPADHAAIASLVGVPPCGAPAALRGALAPAIDTAERERAVFPAPCAGCAGRARCPGVPESYARVYGARGLEPLR